MKKNSRLTLRKLLMLLAVVALLVSMAGCFGTSEPTPTEPSPTETEAPPTETNDPEVIPTDPTEPPETAPEVVMGTVMHDKLNVRSNPSIDSTVLMKYQANTRIVIIEQKVDGEVTWGRTSDGWINLAYVLIDGEEPAPTEPETPTDPPVDNTDGTEGTVTAKELNIRETADADGKKVGEYKKGDKVVILEVRGNWGRTNKGWVSMTYIKLDDKTPDIGTDDKDNTDDKDTTDEGIKTLVTDGKTKVIGYVVIDTDALYVRFGPGTKYAVCDKVYDGESYAYYQEKSGWVRIKDGWISKAYTEDDKPLTDKEATTLVTDGKTEILGKLVVTADTLSTRFGPSTKYTKNGSVKKGDVVEFFQEKNGWVRIKDGWISKAYTEKEKLTDAEASTLVTDGKTASLGKLVITNATLNVRYGPSVEYNKCAEYKKGDTVEYFQEKDGWVRTKDGWISTYYTQEAPLSDKEATTLVSDGNTTPKGKVVVTADSLAVRFGPSTKYAKRDNLKEGDVVDYYEEKDGWIRVKDGWVNKSYTEKPALSDKEATTLVSDGNTTPKGKVVVTAGALSVRFGPGTDYVRHTSLKKDDVVDYFEEKDGWLRTKDGWISKTYTKPAT